MTMLLVSTVRRHIPANEPSGYLYAVDLEQEQIVKKCSIVEPVFRELDDNPRGGMRGSKGITIRDDQLALANFSMVLRYDPQWNLLGVITHPSCAGIHDILFHGDSLWVCSARTDCLHQFDLEGNILQSFYLREPSPAIYELKWKPERSLKPGQIRNGHTDFRDPTTHEKESYDRAHVNSVGVLSNGDVLVSLGFVFGGEFAAMLRLKKHLIKLGAWSALRTANQQVRNALGLKTKNMDNNLVVKPTKAQSAIVRLSPDGAHKLCLELPDMTAPSHSLLVLPDDSVIYLNTSSGEVVHFNPLTRLVFSSTKVTDGFLRGVTSLDKRCLLLGSRGELIRFDLLDLKVEGRVKLTEDANEAVYDVKVLPRHYDLPPDSLERHFEQTVGTTAEEVIRNGYKLQLTGSFLA